jgi:hypothetical protein
VGVAVGAVLLWRGRQPVLLETGGAVVVRGNDRVQRDEWTYRAVMRAADQSMPWRNFMLPLLATPQQIERMPMMLVCDELGRPREWQYHLEPGQSAGFLTRTVAADGSPISARLPVSSPLRTIAQNLYMERNDVLLGQLNETDTERWPTVVIQLSDTSPAGNP